MIFSDYNDIYIEPAGPKTSLRPMKKEEADFQSLYCSPLQAINTAKMSSTIAERKKLCDEGFKVGQHIQHIFMSTQTWRAMGPV